MRNRPASLAASIALTLITIGCAGSNEEAGAAPEERGGAAMTSDSAGPAPQDRAEHGTRALIEFAREIRDEDLEWLRRNGFEIDTVFGRTVRGVLRDPEAGEVIVKDPRVLAVEALMR